VVEEAGVEPPTMGNWTNIINFVGDHQMNIPTKFGSNCPSGFREED
jgi:hypothetical protein